MDLPIEIVQQGSDGPLPFIASELRRVSYNARFHRQGMFAEAIGSRIFAENIPGLFAVEHWSIIAGETSRPRQRGERRGTDRDRASAHGSFRGLAARRFLP